MADVKNPKFVIGNATVMLAPFTENVFELNPDDHSVGMVKSVALEQSADQITLKNGIQQLTVDTQKSNVNMTVTFEGYEFDARNLTYALGLAGSTVKRLRGRLTADAAAAAATISVESYPVPGDSASMIDAVGDVPVGATLLLQNPDEPDEVYPIAVTEATTGTGPYVVTINGGAPVDMTTGWIVWVVNEIDVGSFDDDDFFCAKIVGTLSANNEPIVVVIPKLKVSRGFNLTFSETDYSNLPFELAPIVLTKAEAADQPHLAGFDKTLAKAYVGG